MVDRRGNEVQSDQMKADDRGTEGTSGPFRAYLQKILPIKPVHKKLPFPEVPFNQKKSYKVTESKKSGLRIDDRS